LTVKTRDLVTAIRAALVNQDKFELLKKANEARTYDFSQDKKYTFKPGLVNVANAWTSLIMVGTGMTMQFISLGPCMSYLHDRLVATC
jgi:hypothetical protein